MDQHPSQNSTRVAAVIVTYKRPALLMRCLAAIENQTYKCQQILVVDNCSGDETPDLVRAHFPSTQVISLDQNLGAAGGFHIGMKESLHSTVDWLWLMDDDGIPERDCLEQLLAAGSVSELPIRGPLVYSLEKPDHLSFPSEFGNHKLELLTDVSSQAENGIFYNLCWPWNGILVHRSVPERIGLPKSEMFIWGEEIEYVCRAVKAGVPIGAVICSRFGHPSEKKSKINLNVFGKKATVFQSTDTRRQRIFVRNEAYISRHYRSASILAKHVLKYSILGYKNSGFKGFFTTLSFCLDGVRGVWHLPS